MGKRDRTDLVERLREQLAFLRSSSAGFDRGEEAEAKRLATVRVSGATERLSRF